MKKTGIDWLHTIPNDWNICRVKNAFDRKKEEAHEDDPVVLSLARAGVKIRDLTNNEGQIAESYYNYNPVKIGDLLLNPMDLYSGANCSISEVEGVISPAYINLRARKGFEPRYYDYYFKTQYWVMAMFAHGKGVSFDNRWTLGAEDLLNYYIPVPTLDEQKRIANHLDDFCKNIALIDQRTRETIEEYKRLKISVIHDAISRGIDGDECVACDNEWFDSVSNRVVFSRVGLHFDITLGKMVCSEPKNEDMVEIPYFCAANVHFEGVDSSNLKKMWFSPQEIEQYKVHNGDLLVVEGGAGAGGCAIADNIEETIGIQNSIQIVRAKGADDVRFLSYMIQLLVKRKYIDVACNKATIPHFTKDKLANMPYILWDTESQIRIADYLDGKCMEIDKLIQKKEEFLKELEMYRRSVIYECVTGKREC